MNNHIDWVEYNAGFVKGSVFDGGRKVGRPNAQVVALACFSNTLTGSEYTYADMYERLSEDFRAWYMKPGRTSKHQRFFRDTSLRGGRPTLHSFRMPREFYAPWIEENFEVTWVTSMRIGATAKDRLYLEKGVFGTDPALVRVSSDELIPVIGGAAHYPWDPNHMVEHHARVVHGFWVAS